MKTTVTEIQKTLKRLLSAHIPPLQLRKDEPGVSEFAGTKPGMQGKQKVDGYYFASVVPKPKDVRLYFFPIYTHVKEFETISAALRKCLKGKSCFHIKKLDEELEKDIEAMVKKGVELYQQDALI